MLDQTTSSTNLSQSPSEPKKKREKGSPVSKSSADSLVERDAATYIGMSVAWMRVRRRKGGGPIFVRAGRSVRYRPADLDSWVRAHRVDAHDGIASAS